MQDMWLIQKEKAAQLQKAVQYWRKANLRAAMMFWRDAVSWEISARTRVASAVGELLSCLHGRKALSGAQE